MRYYIVRISKSLIYFIRPFHLLKNDSWKNESYNRDIDTQLIRK